MHLPNRMLTNRPKMQVLLFLLLQVLLFPAFSSASVQTLSSDVTWADHACVISSQERSARIDAAADAFEATLTDLTRARQALIIYTSQLKAWNHTARTQTLLAITGTIAGASAFALPLVFGIGTATGLEIGLNSVTTFVWISTRFYTVFQSGDQSQVQDVDFLLQKEMTELTRKNLSLDEASAFLSQPACESCSLSSSEIEKTLEDLKAWSSYKKQKLGPAPNLWLNPMSTYYREKTAQLDYPEAAAFTTLLTLKKNYQHSLIKVLRHDEKICTGKLEKLRVTQDLASK